jgi:hypothetical protein
MRPSFSEPAAGTLAPETDKKSDEAEPSQQELPLHQVVSEPDGKPKPAAQRNFTDPDRRIMVERMLGICE